MSELVIGGTYLHYKQKRYRVTGVARHSETLEEFVVYETLHDNELGKTWIRPLKMFLEEIAVGDYRGPRFKLIEDVAVF
jgi:hypothetical protein